MSTSLLRLVVSAFVLLLGSSALAQTQLNVNTTKVEPATKPLPPPPRVRQIDLNTDPESTLDVPLSLLGAQILEAVCDNQIDARKALKLMPDLSEAHIRVACPKRLTPKFSG